MAPDEALRILIVEDEFLIAAYLQDLLGGLGYRQAHLAGNLARARELMVSVSPGFAILDVNIGRSLVFPFAAELSSRRVPFVFSTSEPPSAFPLEWRGHLVIPKLPERATLVQAMRGLGLTTDGHGPRAPR